MGRFVGEGVGLSSLGGAAVIDRHEHLALEPKREFYRVVAAHVGDPILEVLNRMHLVRGIAIGEDHRQLGHEESRAQEGQHIEEHRAQEEPGWRGDVAALN